MSSHAWSVFWPQRTTIDGFYVNIIVIIPCWLSVAPASSASSRRPPLARSPTRRINRLHCPMAPDRNRAFTDRYHQVVELAHRLRRLYLWWFFVNRSIFTWQRNGIRRTRQGRDKRRGVPGLERGHGLGTVDSVATCPSADSDSVGGGWRRATDKETKTLTPTPETYI